MTEAVGGVGGRYGVEHSLHGLPEDIPGARLERSKQLLDLAENEFDRIEVGAVRRQIDQIRLARFNQFSNTNTFVAGEVVHDDNVARFELSNQHLFDECFEDVTVDGPIDHGGTPYSLDVQCRDQCGGLPVPVRGLVDQPLATRRASAKPGHVRLGPRFVDKDQSFGICVLRP